MYNNYTPYNFNNPYAYSFTPYYNQFAQHQVQPQAQSQQQSSAQQQSAITNMMYSDYCKIHGNDLMSYVKMARAFLDDDDFDGTPEEKAYLYYKCIVEKE